MPYNSLSDLPDSIAEHLAKHAREICKEVYNNVWEHYKTAKASG